MFVYNTIWLHVHVPIIMLLMNNTRHLLISFQRTISVFYVADSDECTSLHFCSNRLLREMTIKIMFPTTKKKMSLLFAKKKKNNFFFKYIDEALLQKSDVAMVLSLLTIEKSELCENFKSTVILSSYFFRTSAIWKLEMVFPKKYKVSCLMHE